jgi:CRISPR/Cas system-associated exonuclease Cas4 (RecB family)
MDLIKAIDLGTEKDFEAERRCYIGASNVGHPCHAFLQFSLRGYPQKKIPAAVQRIFEMGHIVEEIVVRDLKKSGAFVYEVDPRTKEQWEYTAFGGHLRGHSDGIIAFDKEKPILEVLEIKSMNDKKWINFKNLGIHKSHPIYYYQMQLLMGLSTAKAAWLVAYNKNNSTYHAEHVPYNHNDYVSLIYKVMSVVRDGSAKKISSDPRNWNCRYCNYRPHCWPKGEVSLPLSVECRTCKHSKPVGKRKWFCTLHKSRATDPCSNWYKVESTEE